MKNEWSLHEVHVDVKYESVATISSDVARVARVTYVRDDVPECVVRRFLARSIRLQLSVSQHWT